MWNPASDVTGVALSIGPGSFAGPAYFPRTKSPAFQPRPRRDANTTSFLVSNATPPGVGPGAYTPRPPDGTTPRSFPQDQRPRSVEGWIGYSKGSDLAPGTYFNPNVYRLVGAAWTESMRSNLMASENVLPAPGPTSYSPRFPAHQRRRSALLRSSDRRQQLSEDAITFPGPGAYMTAGPGLIGAEGRPAFTWSHSPRFRGIHRTVITSPNIHREDTEPLSKPVDHDPEQDHEQRHGQGQAGDNDPPTHLADGHGMKVRDRDRGHDHKLPTAAAVPVITARPWTAPLNATAKSKGNVKDIVAANIRAVRTPRLHHHEAAAAAGSGLASASEPSEEEERFVRALQRRKEQEEERHKHMMSIAVRTERTNREAKRVRELLVLVCLGARSRKLCKELEHGRKLAQHQKAVLRLQSLERRYASRWLRFARKRRALRLTQVLSRFVQHLRLHLRVLRKRRMVGVMLTFLRNMADRGDTVRLVKTFCSHVRRVQHYWRSFRAVHLAQLELLRREWGAVEIALVGALAEGIINQKTTTANGTTAPPASASALVPIRPLSISTLSSHPPVSLSPTHRGPSGGRVSQDRDGSVSAGRGRISRLAHTHTHTMHMVAVLPPGVRPDHLVPAGIREELIAAALKGKRRQHIARLKAYCEQRTAFRAMAMRRNGVEKMRGFVQTDGHGQGQGQGQGLPQTSHELAVMERRVELPAEHRPPFFFARVDRESMLAYVNRGRARALEADSNFGVSLGMGTDEAISAIKRGLAQLDAEIAPPPAHGRRPLSGLPPSKTPSPTLRIPVPVPVPPPPTSARTRTPRRP